MYIENSFCMYKKTGYNAAWTLVPRGKASWDEGANLVFPPQRFSASFAVSCTPTLGRKGAIHSVAWPGLSPPVVEASTKQIFLGTQILPVPLGRNKGTSSWRVFAANRYSRPWLETWSMWGTVFPASWQSTPLVRPGYEIGLEGWVARLGWMVSLFSLSCQSLHTQKISSSTDILKSTAFIHSSFLRIKEAWKIQS